MCFAILCSVLHDLHLSHLALSLAALCTSCLASNYTLLVSVSLVEHAMGVGATWVLVPDITLCQPTAMSAGRS